MVGLTTVVVAVMVVGLTAVVVDDFVTVAVEVTVLGGAVTVETIVFVAVTVL